MVKAGLFGFGLVPIIASVNGADQQFAETTTTTVTVDPVIRQLQAFDSSFVELNGLPPIALSDVPKIRLNSHAVKFVQDYNRENENVLEIIRERGDRYFPIMDSVFTLYHLPTELKYLAVIESELKATAVSHVGAVGPWQLMAYTARDLSLKVKGKYDERRNYYKSTVAAAKYLRDLYNQFGDWLLVIAAYNAGPAKVTRAINLSGSHTFWQLQNFLPTETRNHVKRFVSMLYFFEGQNKASDLLRGRV